MIIDADCHISPDREGGYGITIDELLASMDRSGVDMAVTWLTPPYFREIGHLNSYVAEAARTHPDRILGFGWTDPHLGPRRARDEITRCVEELGLHGVKLNGAQNSFYVDDTVVAMPLIEQIADLGTILALHVGTDAYEHTHPFRVAKIAERFPELRIIMVHMGGVGFHDLTKAAIEVAGRHGNITLVGSAVRSQPVLTAIRTLGAHRVAFGSDIPFEPMHVEIARYHALLDGEISAQDKDLVLGGNIARVFGLTVAQPAAAR